MIARSVLRATLSLVLVHVAADARSELPNVVIIVADDLGYGDVHALNPNAGKISTPRIDELCRGGLVFTQGHSTSSVCSPTRYSLLTGRYNWRSKLQRGVVEEDQSCLIGAWESTLPSMLREKGYRTALIGKWHLGYRYTTPSGAPLVSRPYQNNPLMIWSGGLPAGSRVVGGPLEYGFDEHVGFQRAKTMSTVVRDRLVVRDDLPTDQMLGLLGDESRRFIRESRDGPFLLYLGLSAPHTPITPSQHWIGKSGLSAYADLVMEMDHAVGRVLDALRDERLERNTLILFTSDNGCAAASAACDTLERVHAHFASADRRGYKSDIWDGGHRVPFVVRWPQRVPKGRFSDAMVCLVDVMATLADLTGSKLEASAAPDSISFARVLTGEDSKSMRSALVHHSIHGAFAIRTDRWKLALCPGSGGWSHPSDAEATEKGDPAVQLYDLEADVQEQRNLASMRPEVVEELHGRLAELIRRGRSTPGPALPNDVRIRLESDRPALESNRPL